MARQTNRTDVPAGIRRVAVLVLLAFGCTTVRVPVSGMAATVPVHEGVAEPQVELWLESGKPVSAAESSQAIAEARAALGSALAGASAPNGDSVLVVRAQGVTRTSSRRTDQRAAIAGLVVGAVVVVAAVVAVVVATKGKGVKGGGVGSRAVARGPRVRPAAPAPRGSVSHVSVPRWPGIDVNVYAGFDVPAPAPTQDAFVPEEQRCAASSEGWGSQEPVSLPPPGIAEVALPPPSPLALGDRGFFAGDVLRLELVVVDRWYGVPLWVKVVEGKVDPRDASAVRRLLLRALAEEAGWIPAASRWQDARADAR